MSDLSFAKLREANVRRCEQVFHDEVDAWSPTDWACILAGETGEACNLVKKLRRGEKTAYDKDTARDVPIELAIGYELADVVMCADLLAARLGLDLGEMVQEKFNLASKHRGWSIQLTVEEEAGESAIHPTNEF